MFDVNISMEELLEKYPQAISFLSKRGIVCLVCGEPAWGTLAEQAHKKGIEDIQKLVDELSEYLQKTEDSDIEKEEKNTLYIDLG